MTLSNEVVPLQSVPSMTTQVVEMNAPPDLKASPNTSTSTTAPTPMDPEQNNKAALDKQLAMLLVRSKSNLGLDMLASTPSGKAILAAKSTNNLFESSASASVTDRRASKTTSVARHAFMLGNHVTSVMEQRERLVHQQRQSAFFQLVSGLVGVVLMVVQLEYAWQINTTTMATPCPVDASGCVACFDTDQLAKLPTRDQGFMFLLVLRSIISLTTLLLLFNVYRFYVAQCDVLKMKNVLPPSATLFGSPLQNNFLLESVVMLVHPFPGLEFLDVAFPVLLLTLSLVMLVRLLLVIRVVKYQSAFNSSNGWFISSLTSIDYSTWFFFKTCLKNIPFKTMLIVPLSIIGIGGYLLFCFERFVCAFTTSNCCEPIGLDDAMWCFLITMLTIGYGDIIPHTAAGRVTAVFAGFCGTVFAATTIAVLSNMLLLTRSEGKVNAFLRREQHKRLIRDQAARAIQASMQLRAAQSRWKECPHSFFRRRAVVIAEQKLYDTVHKYRRCKQLVRNEELSDPMDRQMTMLEMMEVNVDHVRSRIEELSKTFHSKSRSRRRLRQASSITRASSVTEEMSSSMASIRGSLPPMDPPATTTDQSTTEAGLTQGMSNPGGGSSNDGAATTKPPGTIHLPALKHTTHQGSAKSIASLASVRSVHSTRGEEAGSPVLYPSLGSDGVPEWAIALETTLVTILSQVSRVSMDMEQLTARVHMQMENIGSRIDEIERRMRSHNTTDATNARDSVPLQGRKSIGNPAVTGAKGVAKSHDGSSTTLTTSPSSLDLQPAMHFAQSSVDGGTIGTTSVSTTRNGINLTPLRRMRTGMAPDFHSVLNRTNSDSRNDARNPSK